MKNEPRDIIFNVLNEVYAREAVNKGWWQVKSSFRVDVNKDLTIMILNSIVKYILNPDPDIGLEAEITNIIWNTWAGGGTAQNCAKKIIEVLGIND